MSDTSSSEAELRVSHGCLRLPAQQLCRSRVLAIACWHPVRVSLDDLSAEPDGTASPFCPVTPLRRKGVALKANEVDSRAGLQVTTQPPWEGLETLKEDITTCCRKFLDRGSATCDHHCQRVARASRSDVGRVVADI